VEENAIFLNKKHGGINSKTSAIKTSALYEVTPHSLANSRSFRRTYFHQS